MARHLFTLLTDFGTEDSYVAQMKGVLLSRCPDCCLVDITHQIPPQDIRKAAQILAEAAPRFPDQTTHLVVVDPGVGTERHILAVDIANQTLVLPDNGLLTPLLQKQSPRRVHRVANRQLWNWPISSTFHGRDIIAPVAAFLASGGAWEEVGPPTTELVRLEYYEQAMQLSHHCWRCSVLSQDRFGNILLASSPELMDALAPGNNVELYCDDRSSQKVRVVKTYGDAHPGEIILLRDSQGRLELAQVNGSASQTLGLPPQREVKILLYSTE